MLVLREEGEEVNAAKYLNLYLRAFAVVFVIAFACMFVGLLFLPFLLYGAGAGLWAWGFWGIPIAPIFLCASVALAEALGDY